MKNWVVVTNVRRANSWTISVTSGGRVGLKAATPQSTGGSTRKIDVRIPPAKYKIDHTGTPFSRRDSCTQTTTVIGTRKALVHEQMVAPSRMLRLFSA